MSDNIQRAEKVAYMRLGSDIMINRFSAAGAERSITDSRKEVLQAAGRNIAEEGFHDGTEESALGGVDCVCLCSFLYADDSLFSEGSASVEALFRTSVSGGTAYSVG